MPVSDGGFGAGSANTGSTAGTSAAEAPAEATTDSGAFASSVAASLTGAAVVTTAGSGGVGPRSAIDAAAFSIWGALKVPDPTAIHPASATVPPNARPA